MAIGLPRGCVLSLAVPALTRPSQSRLARPGRPRLDVSELLLRQLYLTGVGLGGQQLPGPGEADDPGGSLRRQADLGAEPAGEMAATPTGLGRQRQDREPLAPAGRSPDAVVQLRADPAEHGLRGYVNAGEFAGRKAQQHPGAQRPGRQLDAGLRALVHDQRRGAVQAAEQGAELTRRLARVGVHRHRHGFVQGEDQRQVRRGQAAVAGGR
jgi:hypothetical protein